MFGVVRSVEAVYPLSLVCNPHPTAGDAGRSERKEVHHWVFFLSYNNLYNPPDLFLHLVGRQIRYSIKSSPLIHQSQP